MTDFANPVELARAVMEDGRHVLLSGAGASRFGIERGLARTDPGRLAGAARRQDTLGGTVGAVCHDDRDGLAVAVSTGGTAGKLPGRVGDSALCGAGFYADLAGAACATGHGEDFVRLVGCRRAVELLAGGLDAQTAADRLIEELGTRVNGLGRDHRRGCRRPPGGGPQRPPHVLGLADSRRLGPLVGLKPSDRGRQTEAGRLGPEESGRPDRGSSR